MWPFPKRRSLDEVCLAVERLSARLERLHDDHEDLKAKHISLRGRVYAAGIHKHAIEAKENEEATVTNITSREELRRRAGFVPGQPMKHSEK